MLKEKVHLLLRSLPQKIRRHAVPLPDYATGFFERWFEHAVDPDTGLLEAIAADMWQQLKIRPLRSDFKIETLPAHLFMNFKIVDEHGRMLSGGRNLDQLKAEHGKQAQASFQRLAAHDDQVAQALAHEQLTDWSFGPLPEIMEIQRKGRSFIGYPALVDKKRIVIWMYSMIRHKLKGSTGRVCYAYFVWDCVSRSSFWKRTCPT